MATSKKFLEAVSKDSALKIEVEQATLTALSELLKSNGLEAEAAKVTEAAVMKVAEAHGFTAEAMEAVSEDELNAVAGGVDKSFCPIGTSIGTSTGKQCACGVVGEGTNDSGERCSCILGGQGVDD